MDKLIPAAPRPIRRRVLCLVCTVGTVVFIFSNSLQTGPDSAVRSAGVLSWLMENFPAVQGWLTEHFVRKMGHLLEYMLLGWWLLLTLRSFTARWLPHLCKPVLAGMTVALCDESIQLFSAGRDGNVADVWLDSLGVLLGIAAAVMVLWLWKLWFLPRSGKGGAV